jgi:hypothetical protein
MTISHRKFTRTLLLSGILLTLVAPLHAQETSTASSQVAKLTDAQNVSPEAQAVLNRMTSYLQTLKSFTIRSHSTRDEVMGYGYKLQHNESSTLTMQKPNLLRSEVIGDIRDRTFIYDGKNLVIYSPNENVYATAPAPDTIGKLVGGLLNAGIEMPTIDVLAQAYNGNIAQKVRGGVLAGETIIEGVVCDHLAFRQSDADWQIWIEQGARPLIRKLVVTTRYEVGDPQYSATLSWDLNPKINKDTFVFTAPKDAAKIPFADPAAINVIEQKGE